MNQKLYSRYSYDECPDELELFEKLDLLKEDGKIEYDVENEWTFKIKDLELDSDDLDELLDYFQKNDIYTYIDESEEDEDEIIDDYDEYDEYDDDSYKRRYKSNDDYEDDF